MLFFRKKPRKIEAFKLTKQIRNLRFSKIKRINQLKSYQFCLKNKWGNADSPNLRLENSRV